MDEGEISAQQFRVAETTRGGGQGGEQQTDDLTADHGGQFQRGIDAVVDDIFARFFGDRRHAFQIGNDEVVAAAQLREGAGAFQVMMQARRRHHPRRLGEVRRHGGVQGRIDVVQLFAVIVEFYAHGNTLSAISH